MAAKLIDLADIGTVALYRRKGVRSVRLSIAHDGTVRITLPSWAPYRLGIEFAKSKADWIAEKKLPRRIIQNGDRVGKAHRFVFVGSSSTKKLRTRLIGTDIKVMIPVNADTAAPAVQETLELAAIRALKKEAEQLLPQRLQTLSQQYGFSYRSLSIKRLKSRWGSCNERTEIVLNCFLMQLPWHLIDYVLLHELTHTKILRHGGPFWRELGKYVKDLKAVRKEMKAHQPALLVIQSPYSAENPVKPIKLAVETP